MTKLIHTTVSPTFHIYPEKQKGLLVQITCANLDACLDTVKGQQYYPAVIKDPNNQKEYYMDKDRNVEERQGSQLSGQSCRLITGRSLVQIQQSPLFTQGKL